jgi:diguanylate cyclase (GGDEF)-like protein
MKHEQLDRSICAADALSRRYGARMAHGEAAEPNRTSEIESSRPSVRARALGAEHAADALRVLVVDDDDDARQAMVATIRHVGYSCVTARSGEEALEILRVSHKSIAVIVLDVQLAGMSGYDVLRSLNDAPGHAPILFVSGSLRSDSDVVHGLDLGAVDFVLKPAAPGVLAAKVRGAYRRFLRERELAEALRSAQSEATTDELTRVYNRRAFEARLAEACASASQRREPLSLLIVDVDHFKTINDRYGHLVGDEALVHIAKVLRGAVRETDMVFRYGGEEFACVLPGCETPRALAVWDRIRAELTAAPMVASDGSPVEIRASAGLAVACIQAGYGCRDLVAAADAALYAAKRGGRDRLQIAV